MAHSQARKEKSDMRTIANSSNSNRFARGECGSFSQAIYIHDMRTIHTHFSRFKLLFIILIVLPACCIAQNLTVFDPQIHYDEEGGLYDPSYLRYLYIDFENPEYHSILSESFFTNPSLRIPATVTFDGTVIDSVGVRYKGNSTFCLPHEQGSVKVPYNLDMNYWISGQNLMDYKKVKLANAWLDPTYCKEFIASRIYRKYLPTPEVNLIPLKTQGSYTGVYVNTESINKQFLSKHFGENDGSLFKGDGAGVFCGADGSDGSVGGDPNFEYLGTDSATYYTSYTIKSDSGWEGLINLIETLEFNPESLHDVLNIDRVLWAMAVNTVVSNLDTYNGYYVHNYYLYQDSEDRFQMIPWDFDNSFVGAIMGFSFWNPNEVYQFDPFWTGWDAGDNRPLTEYLFSHPTYRKQYIAHIRTIMDESMGLDELQAEIDAFQNLAYSSAVDDPNSLFGMAEFNSNVTEPIWSGNWGFGGILSTVEARLEFLYAHPEISEPAPVIGSPAVSNEILQVSVYGADEVQMRWSAGATASDFQSINMVDDGTQGDALAFDGIYTGIMPSFSDDNINFYIRATNSEAMSLSPQRAEYEYYIYGTATGIDDPLLTADPMRSSWSIAPNPASEWFTLQHCEPLTPFTVLDAQGRIVLQNQWSGRPLDISGWDAGVYLIQIHENHSTSTKKLLIN